MESRREPLTLDSFPARLPRWRERTQGAHAEQLTHLLSLVTTAQPDDAYGRSDLLVLAAERADDLDMQPLADHLFRMACLLGEDKVFSARAWMLRWKLGQDWWEAMDFGKVRVSFVPAQHGTRRTLMDANRSHWGGFVMEHRLSPILRPTETIYFAGDSGYFRGFTRIGEMFDIDVSLIPIGAYEPEWFMSPQHVSPEQAVQAFLDVKAKMMIPMHYGAFKLADDTPREAVDRLLAARDRHGITPDRIHLAGLGEVFDLSLLRS